MQQVWFTEPNFAYWKCTARVRYEVRQLGQFDGVKVLEFKPRTQVDASR
jgi:hypothetical protein